MKCYLACRCPGSKGGDVIDARGRPQMVPIGRDEIYFEGEVEAMRRMQAHGDWCDMYGSERAEHEMVLLREDDSEVFAVILSDLATLAGVDAS